MPKDQRQTPGPGTPSPKLSRLLQLQSVSDFVQHSAPTALKHVQVKETSSVLDTRTQSAPSLRGKEVAALTETRGQVGRGGPHLPDMYIKEEKYHVQVQTSEIQSPAKKRKAHGPTLSVGYTTPFPPPITMRWVHPEMKDDLIDAYHRFPQEFGNCCNFWYRYALWKKKAITKSDKQQFYQAAFGTHSTELQCSKATSTSSLSIGVRVHKQWTQYAKHLHFNLRRHFEALLLMFLQSPDSKEMVQSMAQQVRERGSGSISQHSPCISPLLIRDQFIKGNVKLVADVWYPIMDVAPPGFLVEDKFWGQMFIDATCTMLAWMVTHFFRLECPEGKMRFEIGKCPVAAEFITSAMLRVDTDTVIPKEFFVPNKPTDWKQRKNPTVFYGELWNINIVRGVAKNIVEDEVEAVIANSASGIVPLIVPINVASDIALPPVLAGTSETLDGGSLLAQADWVIEVMQARRAALIKVEAQCRKETELLENRVELLLKEMLEHKLSTESSINIMQQRIAMEHFIMECRTIIPKIKQKECVSEGGGRMVSGSGLCDHTTMEITGALAAWMGLMKEHKLFKGAVASYELAESFGLQNANVTSHPNPLTCSEHPHSPNGYPQAQSWRDLQLHPNQDYVVMQHHETMGGQRAIQNPTVMGNQQLIPGQQIVGQQIVGQQIVGQQIGQQIVGQHQINAQGQMCGGGRTQSGYSVSICGEARNLAPIMMSGSQHMMPTPKQVNAHITKRPATAQINAVPTQQTIHTFQHGVQRNPNHWVGQVELTQQGSLMSNYRHKYEDFVHSEHHAQHRIQQQTQHHILSAFGASDWTTPH